VKEWRRISLNKKKLNFTPTYSDKEWYGRILHKYHFFLLAGFRGSSRHPKNLTSFPPKPVKRRVIPSISGSLVPLHGLYQRERSLRPQTADFSSRHMAFDRHLFFEHYLIKPTSRKLSEGWWCVCRQQRNLLSSSFISLNRNSCNPVTHWIAGITNCFF
jgi:hypothetical protein